MKAEDTVMKIALANNEGLAVNFDELPDYEQRNILHQAKISFKAGREQEHKAMIGVAVDEGNKAFKDGKKAGIKHTLSRAVGEGCLSTVKGKHGIHIPDKLYEELSNEAKS